MSRIESVDLVAGDHPMLLQLNTLKEAFDRIQNELHRNSIKLQSDYLKASTETDKLHALQHENALLTDELAVLRSAPHPSTLSSNHPAVAQVQSLTLSLRKLSDQLNNTESTLLERQNDLAKARGELSKAKAQEEKAYELAARIRGREEASRQREAQLEWKVKEMEERERMGDAVMKEYASLVRNLEGRASTSSAGSNTSTGAPPLERALVDGRFNLQCVVDEFKDRVAELEARIASLEGENETLQAQIESLTLAASSSTQALARAETELDKLKIEDTTAAKMVSRYMKFSQSQIDTLQTSIATLTQRHSATLSTAQSQLYALQQTHSATQASLERFQAALDELGRDLVKESVGRRTEVGMRVGMVKREEAVRGALEGILVKIGEGSTDAIQVDLQKVLGFLDTPVEVEEPVGVVGASEARLVAAQYLVQQMQVELRREVELGMKMRKAILELGGEVPVLEPGEVLVGVANLPGSVKEPPTPAATTALIEKKPTASRSPSVPTQVDGSASLSPRAQEANSLLMELEALELEALAPGDSIAPSTTHSQPEALSNPSSSPDAEKEILLESTFDPPTETTDTNAVSLTPPSNGEERDPLETRDAVADLPVVPSPQVEVVPAEESPSTELDEEEEEVPNTPTPLTALIPVVSVSPDPESDPAPAPVEPSPSPSPPPPATTLQARRPSALDLPVTPLSSNLEPESGLGLHLPSEPVEHPLLARLAETAHRYDGLQAAFKECQVRLEDVKAHLATSPSLSLPSSQTSDAPQAPVVPREVLEAVVERLADFVEDAMVEMEVQRSDEALAVKGYETVLVIGVQTAGLSGRMSPGLPSAGLGSARARSFSSSLASLLSPNTPTALGGGGRDKASVQMGDVTEEQIVAFVEGRDPGVQRAMENFERKLVDLRHDVRKVREVVFGVSDFERGRDASEEGTGILYPSPRKPDGFAASTSTSSSSSSDSLAPPPNSAPLPSASSVSSPSSNPNGSWSSWLIRNAASPLSPPAGGNSPRRSPSPATFGNIMTSPRLRHSPSLTGTLRRPGSAASSRSSGSGGIGNGNGDVLAGLELKVPMPKFSVPQTPSVPRSATPDTSNGAVGRSEGGASALGAANGASAGGGPGNSGANSHSMPAPRARTISTMGMLGFGGRRPGAPGGMIGARSGSAYLAHQSSPQHQHSRSLDGGDARSASGGSQGSLGRRGGRKVVVERDIDGDTDLESEAETETETEGEETETEGGGSDSDF